MIDRYAEFGQYGGKAITGTAAVTATTSQYFYKIHFVTSAIVTTQADHTESEANPVLSAITAGFTAGTIVYGKFNSITLSQGNAIAYYSESKG
jgi:hypothetical protein